MICTRNSLGTAWGGESPAPAPFFHQEHEMKKTLKARFDEKWVEANEPHPVLGTKCWLWTAYTCHGGYGKSSLDGHDRYAHRISYERHVGAIPEGLQLDHLCRVRNCVNPAHLEPVTPAENTRRGESSLFQSSKTHCPQGHAYSEGNTRRTHEGHRHCRTCDAASAARVAAKRAKAAGRVYVPTGPRNPKGSPTCRRGHLWAKNATVNSQGTRICKACHRESSARAKLKAREAGQ